MKIKDLNLIIKDFFFKFIFNSLDIEISIIKFNNRLNNVEIFKILLNFVIHKILS